MVSFVVTFRTAAGARARLPVRAPTRWAAYDALFDAVPDGASDVRLRAA